MVSPNSDARGRDTESERRIKNHFKRLREDTSPVARSRFFHRDPRRSSAAAMCIRRVVPTLRPFEAMGQPLTQKSALQSEEVPEHGSAQLEHHKLRQAQKQWFLETTYPPRGQDNTQSEAQAKDEKEAHRTDMELLIGVLKTLALLLVAYSIFCLAMELNGNWNSAPRQSKLWGGRAA
ncbi:hypothetical protein QBC40DRAFT_294033 [Triangularia verruculosa]|uniref:Uncharacterized protein n=1 Tax=Triangularia verruculosa TaxID=2587418 RepID=A0AAN7AZP6_9PEZI|nr:hypothetical protein QBC40DRAFT_294033 [Triangularia verruculosa]